MNEIIEDRKRKKPWIYMPGAQGAVGSTQVQIEWRHSTPHSALRYDPEFAGERSAFHGSNVTAGQVRGYCSGGGPARVLDGYFGYRGSFKNANGFTYTDVVQNPDRSVDAVYANIPDYTWRNTVGQLLDATNTGDDFPTEGGLLAHTGIPRGGNYPSVISQSGGNIPAWQGTDPLLAANVVQSETDLEVQHQNEFQNRYGRHAVRNQ
ncbi:MAG TPA: hypothetical protein VIJ25_05285 [Methylococcales bacterium]